MTGKLTFQVATMTALFVANVLAIAPSMAQQPAGRNPFDGEWSLEFRVATRPGGESRVASRGITPEDVQTINLLMHVSRPSFAVGADGSLRWEQREEGLVHWDDFSRLVGKTATSDCQVVLRGTGEATATPAPAGSGRTYDRRLTLELSWAGSNGSGLDHAGKPWTVALSADGSQWTTNYGTAAVVSEKSLWELEPASTEREEIAPDVIRETAIYRASRQKQRASRQKQRASRQKQRASRQKQSEAYKLGIPPAPLTITERIEIKHIHYLNLVPRG
jgi:hypothetical protein